MKNKKLVFFHDHQITLKNGRLYSSGGLNKKGLRDIQVFTLF